MIDFTVLYDARSGSTFLSRRLMESYEVLIPPEVNFLARAVMSEELNPVIRTREDLLDFCVMLTGDGKFSDWGIPILELERDLGRLLPLDLPEALTAIGERYRERYGDGEKCFGIKKGSYIYAVDRIRRFFPGMKFICLIRDGRAVFASKKRARHSATGKPFAADPVNAAKRWADIRNRIRQLQSADPNRTLVLRYEELARSPGAVIRQAAEFLGAEPRKTAIDAEARLIPDKYRHLHANTGKNAQSDSIYKWQQQLTRTEIFCFEAEAREALAAEGYPLVHKNSLLRRSLGRLVNAARPNPSER